MRPTGDEGKVRKVIWMDAVVGSELIEAKRLRQFRIARPTEDEMKVGKVIRMDDVVRSELIEAKRQGQFMQVVRSTGDESEVTEIIGWLLLQLY